MPGLKDAKILDAMVDSEGLVLVLDNGVVLQIEGGSWHYTWENPNGPVS